MSLFSRLFRIDKDVVEEKFDYGPDEDGDEFDGFIQEADDYLDRKQNGN